MNAAILHGRENIQIEDIAPPPLKPGEVRVRIEAALTCGTDLKVFKRGYHARMIVPPAMFGHELAGTISELGAGTLELEWNVGDRVAVTPSAPCGECFYCKNHQENLCEDLLFLNGGGNGNNLEGSAIVNSVIMNGHYDFHHYDLALASLSFGPNRGYIPTSWQEIF